MSVISVDEHVWRHNPYDDKYVTVILDVTPVHDCSGPSLLVDMFPGRSKKVFQTWLASQLNTWRENIELVAMDGLAGFKSATAEELPDARAVMEPPSTSYTLPVMLSMSAAGVSSKNFTIGAGVPRIPCTRLVGWYTPGHAYSPHASNTHPRPVRQRLRRRPRSHLERLPEHNRRLPLDRTRVGKALMQAEIDSHSNADVPSSLPEIVTLGTTLQR